MLVREYKPWINAKGNLQVDAKLRDYIKDRRGVVRSAIEAFEKFVLPAGRMLAPHFPHMELTLFDVDNRVEIVAFVENMPPDAGDRHQV